MKFIKKIISKSFLYFLKFKLFRNLNISKNYLNAISYLIKINAITKLNDLNLIQIHDIEFNALVKVASLFDRYGLRDQAKKLHRMHIKKLEEIRLTLSPEINNLRFFTDKWFSPIGHIALIDVYIKAEIMGIIPHKKNLIVSHGDFSNRALLCYIGKYIKFTNIDVLKSFEMHEIVEENLQIIKKVTGYSISLYDFCSEVQYMWEQSQNQPLFKLDSNHREMGYEVLKKLGYRDGDWFCGIHVRSSDIMEDTIRNANIATYQNGIKELHDRGGMVLNISSGEYKNNIKCVDGFVDYASSVYKSDWMDIFILAEGEFLIATGSGPSVVPMCFGRPAVFTNWGPLGSRHCSNRDILLPKHYWSKFHGRYLNFRERMSDEYGYTDVRSVLERKNIKIIDNTSEEISSTLIEMYNSVNGISDLLNENERLQNLFKEISKEYNLYPVKVSNSYIESGKY